MAYYLDELKHDLAHAVGEVLGVPEADVVIERPNGQIDADLAIPVFRFAGQLKSSPPEVAANLASHLEHAGVAKAEAAGGFVNLWLDAALLGQGVTGAAGPEYGASAEHQGETVVVDLIGLNLAKPFSIGHLRPTNQGWAMLQLLKSQGYQAVGINHVGDWGTPFGKWMVGFQRFGSEDALERDGVYELQRIYIEINQALKGSDEAVVAELNNEIKSWVQKLEAGDAEAKRFHERFMRISLEHMNQVLARLKVEPDENLGESFYITGGAGVTAGEFVEGLIKKGIAIRQDDGSVIVSLEDAGIDVPALLQKSDGTSLYATSDTMAIQYRMERWKPSKIVYAVAAEQQFHFRQVFALVKKLGYDQVELIHAWFGLIQQKNDDGTRSKMSSRKGTVLLEELLDQAEEEVRKRFKEAGTDEDVSKVAVGAIKFTDFAQSRQSNILFDWDRMFSLTGFSGPYVQYAAVRVGAILAKAGEVGEPDKKYDWQAEKPLLVHLANYPSVVRAAAEELEPHQIAQYAYDLAKLLNQYYETTPVLQAEAGERAARLALLQQIRQNFEHALGLLGIEVPGRM